MKKYELRYLDTFYADVAEIVRYMEEQLVSPALVLTPIFDRIVKELPSAPYLYPSYSEDARFRKMVVENHLVFYVIDEENLLVKIHHIWNSRRDTRRLMNTAGNTTLQ
jgi:hypothetical protein